jgi:hypothetical protein
MHNEEQRGQALGCSSGKLWLSESALFHQLALFFEVLDLKFCAVSILWYGIPHSCGYVLAIKTILSPTIESSPHILSISCSSFDWSAAGSPDPLGHPRAASADTSGELAQAMLPDLSLLWQGTAFNPDSTHKSLLGKKLYQIKCLFLKRAAI